LIGCAVVMNVLVQALRYTFVLFCIDWFLNHISGRLISSCYRVHLCSCAQWLYRTKPRTTKLYSWFVRGPFNFVKILLKILPVQKEKQLYGILACISAWLKEVLWILQMLS
jgi:hypothetical protein